MTWLNGRYCVVARIFNAVLAVMLLGLYHVRAQENSGRTIRDSLSPAPPVNRLLLRSFQPKFVLPQTVGEVQEMTPRSLQFALTYSSTTLSSPFQQQMDLVSPWKKELAKENEHRTLRTILGAVQAGGTAYLLYEHIRKYGLK